MMSLWLPADLDVWDRVPTLLGDAPPRWATPGALAQALDSRTVQTTALDVIDRALVDVANGRCKRLIISCPPQEGKSQRVSRRFPLWLLDRNRDLRIVIASYEHGVARRWGRDIRNDIATFPDVLGLSVQADTSAAHEWKLAGHDGGVYCVGIGGALTGRPGDCLRGDSLITTERGYVSIRDLHESANRPRVLAFNHLTGRVEWSRIVATRAIADRPLVEVVTVGGRRIACTPDHRFFVEGRGYVAAVDLDPGDHIFASAGHRADLRRMRVEMPEAPARDSEGGACGPDAGVLHEEVQLRHDVPGVGRGAALRNLRGNEVRQAAQVALVLASMHARGAHRRGVVLPLPHAVRVASVRVCKAGTPRWRNVLFSGLRGRRASLGWVAVPAMWKSNRVYGPAPPILLEGVPPIRLAEGQGALVPAVWAGVLSEERAYYVLRSDLCERGARSPDDRLGQLSVHDRNQLRQLVPSDASVDFRAGWPRVRGVQGARRTIPGGQGGGDVHAYEPGGASHQRDAVGQRAIELDHVVQEVPCGSPRVCRDTVAVVRQIHGERDTVYDLQVEGHHNFFAGEVLVHNCMIIDDPHKGRKEADSETYRNAAWDWWTETARTRLSPDAPVVLILTRWHEDDLAGRLLREDESSWTVINIPAQANHRPEQGGTDILGRQPGEYLHSTRGRHLLRPTGSCPKHPDQPCCDWDDIKRDVGARAWNALYQGEPSPPEGTIFKRQWWRFYDRPQWVERDDGTRQGVGFDELAASWDMTFKGTDGTDYVCGQVWGRRGATAFLLDQVLERMSFVDTCQAVRVLSARWPKAAAKLVEDKANGPAVISSLRRTVPGLVPVQPDGSKQARAAAVSPFVESGNVVLPAPELAPWVGGLVDECSNFPNGRHDDQVDALSQALTRLLLLPSKPRVRWM